MMRIISRLDIKNQNVIQKQLDKTVLKTIDKFYRDNKSEIFEFYDYKKIKNLLSKNINLNHYSKFLFSFINAKIFLDNIN